MSTPFDRSERRMERVSLPEFHRMILARTNKGYMPFTHQDALIERQRPQYNSKPEYIWPGQLGPFTFEQFRNMVGSWGASGYFARGDMEADERTIYAGIYLRGDNWVLFVNLTSLETYVGEWKDNQLTWYFWPHLQYLAIDRLELSQQIKQL